MTTPDTTTAKPERAWVWWCDEESITAGKISVLAIVETFAAVGVWWWLAMHYNWSIFSFVALFAAPMLLLRSNASIVDGVAMLARYEESISKTEKVVIVIAATLFTIGMTYKLEGEDLFWGAALALAVLTGTVARVRVVVIEVARVSTGTVVIIVSGFVLALVFNPPQRGLSSVAPHVGLVAVTFLVVFAMRIVFLSQVIRLWATLRHPLQGMTQLPQNWRETLWVIDLSHPPELIPQAGEVSVFFTVKSQWENLLIKKAIAEKLLAASLILFFYPPALAYRWSLKASAWLWFPLILLLKPPFVGLDERACCKETVLSVSGKWRLLLWIPVVLLAWLTISALPQLSLLYIMLWLLGGLTIWYYLASENLKLLHTDELKPKQFANLPAEEKAIFLASARHVEKLRLALIACVVIGGYAFAATWLHTKNPTYAEHFIAPWLLRIL